MIINSKMDDLVSCGIIKTSDFLIEFDPCNANFTITDAKDWHRIPKFYTLSVHTQYIEGFNKLCKDILDVSITTRVAIDCYSIDFRNYGDYLTKTQFDDITHMCIRGVHVFQLSYMYKDKLINGHMAYLHPGIIYDRSKIDSGYTHIIDKQKRLQDAITDEYKCYAIFDGTDW